MIDDDDLTEARIRQLLTAYTPPTRQPDIDAMIRAGRQRSAWHAWERGIAAAVTAIIVLGAGILTLYLAGHTSNQPVNDDSPTVTATPGALPGLGGFICHWATTYTILPHGLSADQTTRFFYQHVKHGLYFDKSDPRAVWKVYKDPAESTKLPDGSPRPLPSWWANLTPVTVGVACDASAATYRPVLPSPSGSG
jgi:hypothetical protein